MRLGQAHGPGPAPVHDFWKIERLDLVRAEFVQSLVRAVRKAGIHAKTHIGAADHFLHRRADQGRHPHAAVFRIAGQPRPAARDKGIIGFLESFGRCDIAVIEAAAFAVAALVDREKNLLADFCALFQNLVDKVR